MKKETKKIVAAKKPIEKKVRKVAKEIPENIADTKVYIPGKKTVYSIGPNGEYAGETIAHECQLEPGVYHIPANATDVKPLYPKSGFIVVYDAKIGNWKHVEIPVEKEKEIDPAAIQREKVVAIKAQRDHLLRESDYTQLSDVLSSMKPSLQKAWIDYRLALRNITNQKDFPDKVEFPNKPE
jgi:hypothetical protein